MKKIPLTKNNIEDLRKEKEKLEDILMKYNDENMRKGESRIILNNGVKCHL